MRHSREELLQQMDMALANQKDRIVAIQDQGLKKDLEKVNQAVEDLYLKIQMDEGLKIHTANKRMNSFYSSLVGVFKGKYMRAVLLAFIAGLIVALIPTLLYISSLKDSHLPKYNFVSNAVGYPKATFVQVITTNEQIELIKGSKIRDAHMADIGSALKIGKTGLNLMPSAEMKSPTYHLKHVGIQQNLVKDIAGFHFEPDTLWTRDPIELNLLTTDVEVEVAKNTDNIDNKDLLSIGAAIVCPSEQCFVTAKATLETEYEKIIPISEL